MKITDFIIESKVLLETRTPNQILMELNVINIPQIDSFLTDISQNLPTKELQKWFNTRGKKYLINSEDDNSVITHFSGKAEKWMKQRQKEGVQMHRFDPSLDLTTKFTHVVDWIRAMNDTVTGVKVSDQQSTARAKKSLKGLGNTSMSQAIESSNAWLRDMNTSKESSYVRAEDETGLVPVMAYGDHKWYKLTDQDCLDREGKVMGHCIASYGARVESGDTVIYSLRDNNNFSHATVEVNRGELIQVKGKRNAPPVKKYQRATVALLNTLNVPPSNSGMNDIRGMDFLYNKSNNKYGTIQDIGDKVHDEGGISVWSIGGQDVSTISLRIMVGDDVVCSIGNDRYSRGLRYTVNDEASLMNSITVKDAKYNDTMYKLAKFITQVIPQSPSKDYIDLKGLSSYITLSDDTGLLKMSEDIGKLIFTDNDDQLRHLQPGELSVNEGDATETYIHLNKGKLIGSAKYNEENKNIGDRRTIGGTGYHGIKGESLPILTKYINTLKQKDRPIIQDDSVYQHPTTFEASEDHAGVAEPIAVSKSDDMGWYKIINSGEYQNSDKSRRHRPYFNRGQSREEVEKDDEKIEVGYQYVFMKQRQRVLTIDVNADETKHRFKIYYEDALSETNHGEINAVANLFNKSGLTKFYPFTNAGVVSTFENLGLYFLREKRMFTTDHSIAGEQFQHDDKEFKAIKTHNHLKIYYKGAEVVIFDLATDLVSKSGPDIGIKDIHLKNRLAMLNNVRKIADVLNHYEIHRKDTRDTDIAYHGNTNKKIAQAGLTYSHDNGWKGMKSGPKPVESTQGEVTRTIGKSDYEIHSFKRDFLIQDAETHELIATFKGSKNRDDTTLYINKIQMDSQKESAFDIVADALNDLNQKEGVKVQLSSNTFNTDREFRDFKNKLNARDYTGASGNWGKISEKYPSEVISKGAGGTWIKEAFTKGIDPDVEAKQKEAQESRYSDSKTTGTKTVYKYHQYTNGLSGENYTLYSRKTPTLRAYVRRDTLQAIYRVIDDEHNVQIIHDKETFLKYGNAIGRLLHKLEIGGGNYLTDHGLYLVKGKLNDVSKNPKLAGFISGEVVYEDGHKWKRGDYSYRENEWTLSLTIDGITTNLIQVDIDEHGLKSISFKDAKVRKHTKLYRPFLNDIMDIFDQLYGSF